MLTGMEHKKYATLDQCPICHCRYDLHWKVVSHIRKCEDNKHVDFLTQQEKEVLETYKDSERSKLHENLFYKNNIFCGISFCRIRRILHREFSPEDMKNERIRRISETMAKTPKTKQHNANVAAAVKKAWKEGKFDTEKVKEARIKGYANRRSFKGKGNPMYGKPSPKGSGRGKGGIRKDIGHYVRSRWEANICRIYNLHKRPYEYEKYRFTVDVDGSQMTYSPDLYLPDKDLYIEIKGHARSAREWICECDACLKCKKKMMSFKKIFKHRIILIGRLEYHRLKKIFSGAINEWEPDK